MKNVLDGEMEGVPLCNVEPWDPGMMQEEVLSFIQETIELFHGDRKDPTYLIATFEATEVKVAQTHRHMCQGKDGFLQAMSNMAENLNQRGGFLEVLAELLILHPEASYIQFLLRVIATLHSEFKDPDLYVFTKSERQLHLCYLCENEESFIELVFDTRLILEQ